MLLKADSKVPDIRRSHLLPWISEEVLPLKSTEAHGLFERLATEIPEVARLRFTPQGPLHHAEGPHVGVHVERMVAVLLALLEKDNLQFLEEVAREKEYALEFEALLEVLKENRDFFLAYIFAHDLGKDLTLSFDVRDEKKGKTEGFHQHDARTNEQATEPERQRYDKIFRAFSASHGELLQEKLVAAFFDEYGVETHYKGHDREGGSVKFAHARESLLSTFGVSLSHAKLLAELIRLHMDVLMTFERGVDASAYKAFTGIALKAGLNKDLFLDLAAGALFLDGIIGSLHYEGGTFSHSLKPLMNLFRAEREAQPERHALREEKLHRTQKVFVKNTLRDGGLSPEDVFSLLDVPVGPLRGEVMKKVYYLLHDPECKIDFGEYTEELRRRARKTQALFQERGIAINL